MSLGFFITFEGLDGSGKTTQLGRLADALTAEGREVVTLRQPGGTLLGDRIRGLLLDTRTESAFGGIAPEAELALMFADRAQSLRQVVKPALEAGAVVLCDRYTDSSEAYQGAGRQLGVERELQIHAAVCGGFQPDLTLLLLPPFEASLARARRRNERTRRDSGTDENRFEREDDGFYRRVYDAYRHIAAREPGRVVVFEGAAMIETVAARIAAVVAERTVLPSLASRRLNPDANPDAAPDEASDALRLTQPNAALHSA